MNFYHVHWSKPMKLKRWEFDIQKHIEVILYHYSLSLAYLKKLGQTVDLYTDTEGAELFNHLPYDNIYVVLDDMDERIMGTNWAAGKIEALKHSKLSDVYIDGDVFIKTQKCLDKIQNSAKYDGFFFGHENMGQYNRPEEYLYFVPHNIPLQCLSFPYDIPIFGYDGCNGGLIMFNNQEYKDKFISAYDDMLKQVVSRRSFEKLYEKDRHICFDLVMEQRFLWEVGKNYNIGYLVDFWNRDQDNIQNINKECNAVGVQHVIGVVKYKKLDKCIETLQKINPDIYQSSYEKLQSYI